MSPTFKIYSRALGLGGWEISSRGNGIRLFKGPEDAAPYVDRPDQKPRVLADPFPYEIHLRNEQQLNDFCRCYDISLPEFPPAAHAAAMNVCSSRRYRPWEQIMGVQRYQQALWKFGAEFSKSLEKHPTYIYWSEKGNNVMHHLLGPARISIPEYEKHHAGATQAQKSILETFNDKHAWQGSDRTHDTKCIEPPVYSTTATKTGRMVVKSGPNILLLKKEYRSMIRPRDEQNKLLIVDLVALEPRVLLALSNPSVIGRVPQDIYTQLLVDLNLEKSVTRAVAKIAVLSIIYGQGEEATIKTLKPFISKPEDFLVAVRDYFNVDSYEQTLRESFAKANEQYLYNLYNRPIKVDEGQSHLLLNYMVQSTAVDVARLVFEELLIEQHWPVLAKYQIHDAIIVEASPREATKLLQEKQKYVEGIRKFPGVRFFFTVEEL